MAGRHRSFDKEEVLDTVMKAFWRNGFAGTSMSDLTGATGLTKPSLYAAYGNKEGLFKESLHRYIRVQSDTRAALYAPDLSLKDRVANYLRASVELASDPNAPGGCFILASTCEASSEAMPLEARKTVNEINTNTRSRVTDFFEQEQAEGHLTSAASPERLADYFLVLQAGLVLAAQKGTDPVALDGLIDHAVSTLPLD